MKCTPDGFIVALQAAATEGKATDAQAQADLEAEGSAECCLALAGPPPLHPGLHPCLQCHLVALLTCLVMLRSTAMCMLSRPEHFKSQFWCVLFLHTAK